MDDTQVRRAIDLLTGAVAGGVLRTALERRLDHVEIRSVHRRGGGSASVVYEVQEEGAPEATWVVAHVSTRPVPGDATVVDLDGVPVHVWRYPHDPYLPGLPSAVDPARVPSILEQAGQPVVEATAVTRAYRPTRRAVVTVESPDRRRLLFLKVLGGRSPSRVTARTHALVDVHERLGQHLPVPRVLHAAEDMGVLAMAALSGRTLRSLLLQGSRLPDPLLLVDLTRCLASIPDVDANNDPRRYADISRHVHHLSQVLPDQREPLERIAAVVATLQGPVGTVHGDLHDGQLLFDQQLRLTGVLDVDGVGPGDLASDAGRLIAHVEAAGLVDDLDVAARQYPQQLWEAYADLLDPVEVAKGAAAAWVGLATGPYRSHRPGWADATRQRLDRAMAWIRCVPASA